MSEVRIDGQDAPDGPILEIDGEVVTLTGIKPNIEGRLYTFAVKGRGPIEWQEPLPCSVLGCENTCTGRRGITDSQGVFRPVCDSHGDTVVEIIEYEQ